MIQNSSNKKLHTELSKHRALFVLAIGLGALIFFGWLGSYFRPIPNQPHRRSSTPAPNRIDPNDAELISQRLMANVNSSKIAEVLHALTVEPHVSGTEANKQVAEKIAEIWKNNGLQDVHFVKYNVLLSYPNFSQPNHVYIFDATGNVTFKTSGLSPDLNPHSKNNENDYRSTIQWLAYSENGTVDGDAVYCHYGTPADFEVLKNLNISLEGKIAIMRYNTDFRGDKVKHAQEAGAIGAIIYSDPTEVAGDGIEQENVYPSKYWLPSGGVQRGSILQCDGDALTPLLPAHPDLYPGRTIEEAKKQNIIPSIPVIPLSYSDAYQILSRLGGSIVPDGWQGGLNFTYHIGADKKGEETIDSKSPDNVNGGLKLRLEVHSELATREIQNVIGYIYGEDLDSYVMLGNHFDAWVYGAIDPISGTSILAEVARAFTTTMDSSNGWKPKRTLMFCAWDAEEYGLTGSTEFVQEFAEVLKDRAVIYLNVDLISSNQTLDVRTTPTVFQSVVDVAKKVANPVDSERAAGRGTVYDTWLKYFPSDTTFLPTYPKMNVPGGNSDHMSFLNFLGVPVVDITYRNATWNSYPLYHSMYEIPYVNEHLFDMNNLAVHKAVAQYWAELARHYADAPVIPLNATILAQKLLETYISDLKEEVEKLKKEYPEAVVAIEVARKQVSKMIKNAQEFLRVAIDFEVDVTLFNINNLLHDDIKTTNRLNRRLQKLEQCFINPNLGLAEKDPEKRHVLYSLSSDDSYSARVMAAVFDVINTFRKAKTIEEWTKLGKQLAYEITVVQNAIQCATNLLKTKI